MLQQKAQTWGLQNWAKDAQARTAAFRREGPRGPATWIFNEGKNIPPGAIVVGQEHSWKLYICRAFCDVRSLFLYESMMCSLILITRAESVSILKLTCNLKIYSFIEIGKASDAFKKGAVIGYCNEEIHVRLLPTLNRTY